MVVNSGWLEVIQWVYVLLSKKPVESFHLVSSPTLTLFAGFCANGNELMSRSLEWLVDEMVFAADSGSLELLEMAYDIRTEYMTSDKFAVFMSPATSIPERAAVNGHHNIIQWLHSWCRLVLTPQVAAE